MSVVMMRIVGLSVAALIVVCTGVVLTRVGWPFGTGLLTVHKLIALAPVVYIGVLAYGLARAGSLTSTDWTVLSSAIVLTIAVFASGGVVSALQSAPAWVVWVHRIGSWIAVLGIAAAARLAV